MGIYHSTHSQKKRLSSKLNKKSSPNNSSLQDSTAPSTKPGSISSQSCDSVFRNGRRFHNESTSTYWLPNDDEEMDRLVGEHFALKTLFGGNIPELAIQDERISLDNGARILDLGCGAGTWIMDVATEYPGAELIGLDMCDTFPANIRPANVSFQIGNMLDGLHFEDNSFDIVNFGFFVLAFKTEEWLDILKEIKRVLKPGGYLCSREPGMLDVGNEFVLRAGTIFKGIMAERGQEPYISEKMKDIMSLAGFDVVQFIKKDTFPGRTDQLNKDFLWDLQHIFKSGQALLEKDPLLVNEKYSQFLEELVTNLQKEPEAIWSITRTLAQKPI